MPMSDAELNQLRKATARLLYPSESDYPLDIFHWDLGESETSARELVVRACKPRADKIEEVSLDAFFTELAGVPDAEQFRELRHLLESDLTNLQVFRVGEIEIHIYIVGRTRSNNWIAVHTVSIET